jgi:hypothetical protein
MQCINSERYAKYKAQSIDNTHSRILMSKRACWHTLECNVMTSGKLADDVTSIIAMDYITTPCTIM